MIHMKKICLEFNFMVFFNSYRQMIYIAVIDIRHYKYFQKLNDNLCVTNKHWLSRYDGGL